MGEVHPVRVLEAVAPPDGTTRYVDQVTAYPDPDIEFSYISVPSLVRMAYDVVHFHWPEMIVQHRNPVIERARCAAFDGWVRMLRWRRIGIVRTLHNPAPHDGARAVVRRSLDRLDRATDEFVAINSETQAPENSSVVLHGHYRDRFRDHTRAATVPGRLVYAGLIRPYKGIEQLLTAFGAMALGDETLRIVGRPTPELRTAVESAMRDDPSRISARLEFVPDADFVSEVTAAEIVCLPYRELENSGIALVALSLDRPVLVPDTASTRALEAEVGPGWVFRFSGDLATADLQDALRRLRSGGRSPHPQMQQRDWQNVGAGYSAAFRRAQNHARRRSR